MLEHLKNWLAVKCKGPTGRGDEAVARASRPRSAARRRASFRPNLEALEDRLVMSSSGTITNASDWGGALHEYAIHPGGTLQEKTSQYAYHGSSWSPWSGSSPAYESFNSSAWHDDGGPPLVQISAARDNGLASCYGIDTHGEIWEYREFLWGPGYWQDLHGQAVQISAGESGTVYALASNGTLWGTVVVQTPNGDYQQSWAHLNAGGPGFALQISAGETSPNPTGRDVLWAIDSSHNVWSLEDPINNYYANSNYFSKNLPWTFWGGWGTVTQISGTVHGNVYAIGYANAIWYIGGNGNWAATGGYGSAISAGTDWSGNYDRLFQIGLGSDHGIYEYSQSGPWGTAGWRYDGGYANSIAATTWAANGQGGRVMLIGGEGAAFTYWIWPPHNDVGWTNYGHGEWDFEGWY